MSQADQRSPAPDEPHCLSRLFCGAGDKEAEEWWMKVPQTSRFMDLADERAWQGAWQMKASVGVSEKFTPSTRVSSCFSNICTWL